MSKGVFKTKVVRARYIQRERSLSAQAHGSERLSLRLRVPIQAPELSKITYKQELILDMDVP